MKRNLPKKPWQGYPESGTLPLLINQNQAIDQLVQTRKCTLFLGSFGEETLMSFSGDAVKLWLLGQKADCSVLTVTHLHQPHSICLSLPHTKGFQQKDPALWVWEPPQVESYSFHTQFPHLIGLKQKEFFLKSLRTSTHVQKSQWQFIIDRKAFGEVRPACIHISPPE